ncbi:hypothetical protein COW81_02595 [Candidatus Campbellbacteria bacterium CG22_combo_CG10-13_8_21_14_all_36_13]|uniref:DOD-type homing endonuclease domain-containing protein n=1 Tax=Candidatus Campbellbacteria bacterium CG22_combo_CG10-13_8_21_14_all_36_13 TaxID=1974529 RepID=A0A2H0DXT2_9BACT|nr:MAG: hypothetical protein COW81_02595 [Candidatus Campbellbacteria bacterium CG22_combo_CG10-13_8_21_14_all_36_13]
MKKINRESRVLFSFGDQKRFLETVKEKSNMKWETIANVINIHDRTLRDWRNEKYTMPLSAVKKLSQTFSISVPKKIIVKNWGSHLSEAGKKGGIIRYKKYGHVTLNEKERKKAWEKWWNEKGRFSKNTVIGKALPVTKPDYSESLAEFIGVVLGDGSISKNQIVIYLHKDDDREYGKFVSSLTKELFKIPVGIYQHKTSNNTNYIISRIGLVNYFTEHLGMSIGNKVKQQVDIPVWIKCNPKYARACVRGLIDTDGCFFIHQYNVGGKKYSYNKILYTSRSKPLLNSVFEILKSNKIKGRFSKKDNVWLDSKESVEKYLRLFGTNNPKHLNKFQN